jgi:hypothetical protein
MLASYGFTKFGTGSSGSGYRAFFHGKKNWTHLQFGKTIILYIFPYTSQQDFKATGETSAHQEFLQA